jgi:hypothetical protein
MKRIPLVAGVVLVVVLVTVGVLVRSTHATNDPVFCSCGSASSYISQKYADCMYHGGNPTGQTHCFDAADGNPGSYSYSCSWGPYPCPGPDPDPGGPYNPYKMCGGGFGGGNVIDPTDPSCQ